MDTTNKHIGNLLSESTDKGLHEILLQFMEKQNMSKDDMLLHFSRVLDCKSFDYYGSISEHPENSYLKPEKSRIVVTTHENSDGYECDHEYVFENINEVRKFLGLCDDVVTCRRGKDIYGELKKKSYYETVQKIVGQTEYQVVNE